MPTIKVSEETWQRLQAIATPFRGSELGTPDKVIERLLDVYESEVPAPDRVPASARRRVRGARLSSQFSYDVTRSSAARKRVSRSITSSAHPCGSSQARPKRSSSSLSAKVPHKLVAPGRAGDAGLLVVERKVRSRS
jgi:hypothetical protein